MAGAEADGWPPIHTSMGALAWCPASAADPPASVNQLIIAMDGWGSDLIDPWEFAQPGFIADYLNLRLLTRDENMKVQPLWAVEWSQNDQGIDIRHYSLLSGKTGCVYAAQGMRGGV